MGIEISFNRLLMVFAAHRAHSAARFSISICACRLLLTMTKNTCTSSFASSSATNPIPPTLVQQVQDLTLHASKVRQATKVDNESRFGFFYSVVSPLHMPCFHPATLDFISGERLGSFLLVHVLTIRDLYLLGRLRGGDEYALARWDGDKLHLTGIKLSGFLSRWMLVTNT